MIRLLRWLIWRDAHFHVWQDSGRIRTFEEEDTVTPTKIRQIQRCSVCGKMRVFRM